MFEFRKSDRNPKPPTSEDIEERAKSAAARQAIDTIRDFFNWQFSPEEAQIANSLGYLGDALDKSRGLIMRQLNRYLEAWYREKLAATVKSEVERYVRSEEFLDSLIDRINRKQVRASGMPEGPSAGPPA